MIVVWNKLLVTFLPCNTDRFLVLYYKMSVLHFVLHEMKAIEGLGE